MKKVKTKNMTAIILSVLILFSGTAIALSGSEIALSGNKIELTVPSPLIETQWLADNINNVVLLDVRKKAKKNTERIANAVLVPWKKVRAKTKKGNVELIKMLPSKDAFEKLMQSLGANNKSAIIITNKSTSSDSVFFGTRLYWQLKYFGHDNVALLNGGNAKWFKEKRAITTYSAKNNQGNWTVSTQREDILATTKEVEQAVKDKKTSLIDARSEDMYLGLFYKKKYVYASGHIPGAKLADGNTFLHHGKVKTFHNPQAIKMALVAKGINPDAKSITFCNSGHLASGIWFIKHELLGNKNASLYDGSMHAWTKDKKHPVVNMKVEN